MTVATLAWPCLTFADDSIAFPEGSVVDVVAEYPGVEPDNGKNDTAGLQQALHDYAETNRILWLRNGEYLVSDTLAWQGALRFNTLQGESRDGTIIRLIDGSPGFGEPENPKPVINIDGGGSADRFQNEIYDLTIDVGQGNPGATGLRLIANNQGGIRSVRIVSAQNEHGIGLDLSVGQNGPLMVRDVEIEGFSYGIRTGNAINSATLEHVTVRDQGAAGWLNVQQVVTARRLISEQSLPIPAVINGTNKFAAQHWFGTITLLDCEFITTYSGENSDAPFAISAVGNTIAHRVDISGYEHAALAKRAGFLGGQEELIPLQGPGIVRWLKSYRINNDTPFFETALFGDTGLQAFELEVLETPDVPWDHPEQWVNLDEFTVGDGVTDDTAGFQEAIDSMKPGNSHFGMTTLLVPNGSEFRIDGIVEIGGPVRRIIGTKGRIRGNGVGRFRVVDSGENDAPVLRIERLSGFASQFEIEHASSRTVAVLNTTGVRFIGNGTGDLFIEDIVGAPHQFNNPGQRIWARQFNAENAGTKIVNEGAKLWMLGIKTEKFGTVLDNRNGGEAEIYGGLIYRVDLTEADDAPMFSIENASTLLTGIGEYDPSQNQSRQYENIVLETKSNQSLLAEKDFFPEISRHNNSAVVAFYQSGLKAGDLNADGVVNVFDLLILLENWGGCPLDKDCPADLNGDDVVNVFDLLVLLENWG